MEQLSSLPSLDRNDLPRIGIRQDLLLIPTSAFLFGFVSGLVTSSRLSGRQFLAENAHRLPTTVQGWYFYTKTKNYRVMHGGIKGGLKTGGRLGAWTLAFIGLEEGIEYGMRSVSSTGLEGWRTRSISGGISGLALASAATQICLLKCSLPLDKVVATE